MLEIFKLEFLLEAFVKVKEVLALVKESENFHKLW